MWSMCCRPTGCATVSWWLRVVAGQERAGVTFALDEGVHGVAIGGDAGGDDLAVFVGVGLGRFDGFCAAAGGFAPCGGCVLDDEGDGADAVSVLVDVLGDLGVGAERGGEDEADFSLLKDVGGAVAEAGFGAGIGDELHAEGGAVKIGGLPGVADVELDVVGAFEGKKILMSAG